MDCENILVVKQRNFSTYEIYIYRKRQRKLLRRYEFCFSMMLLRLKEQFAQNGRVDLFNRKINKLGSPNGTFELLNQSPPTKKGDTIGRN